MKLLLLGTGMSVFTSCVSTNSIDDNHTEMIVLDSEGKAVYEQQELDLGNNTSEDGFMDGLIEGLAEIFFSVLFESLTGSDPDGDNDYSPREKDEYLRENGDDLRNKLEDKKE